MSKSLALIAAGGFVLCLAFFALAFAFAGGNIFAGEKPFTGIKPLIDMATRKVWRWDGGDTLMANGQMVLHYRQDGPAGITVTGPAEFLGRVKVGGGEIASNTRRYGGGTKLDAVVSGVPIREFTINGNQQLQLGHVDQESLNIRINGNGSVNGEGRVGQLNLSIAGKGNADLGDLEARDAKVVVMGDGDATLAPRESLFVTIAGKGVIRLRTHPASIHKIVLGSGRIVEEGSRETRTVEQGSQTEVQPRFSRGGSGSFVVTGSGDRELGRLEQDDVKLTVAGSGNATANGNVDRLSVMVAGSGDARLGQLSARQVDVTIAGSGDATIAPQEEAKVTILGSGNVYLRSRPRKLEQNIMGSGRIIEAH